MTKAELKKIERLKLKYLSKKHTADEIFNRSLAEYNTKHSLITGISRHKNHIRKFLRRFLLRDLNGV